MTAFGMRDMYKKRLHVCLHVSYCHKAPAALCYVHDMLLKNGLRVSNISRDHYAT
jgi:hypothetical protein